MTGLSVADCAEIREAAKWRPGNYQYKRVARWLTRAGFVETPGRGRRRVWEHPSGTRVVLREHGRRLIDQLYVMKATKILLNMGLCPDEP